jgi:hypothetical protein
MQIPKLTYISLSALYSHGNMNAQARKNFWLGGWCPILTWVPLHNLHNTTVAKYSVRFLGHAADGLLLPFVVSGLQDQTQNLEPDFTSLHKSQRMSCQICVMNPKFLKKYRSFTLQHRLGAHLKTLLTSRCFECICHLTKQSHCVQCILIVLWQFLRRPWDLQEQTTVW